MDTQDEDSTLDPPPSWGDEAKLAAAVEARAFPGLTPVFTGEHAARAPELHRLGRFVVLRELGRGGMGVVYACYDEQLDRKVAVKLLGARFESETRRRRLEREGQALARLSHPNVVQVYELGEHHGAPFVAMEFVVGQTLRQWLAAQATFDLRQRWREAIAMLRQVGAGLEAAHAAGLVHRDFKPDNVIVGADGRARVLDFGLVRHAPEPSEVTTGESPRSVPRSPSRSKESSARTLTDEAIELAPADLHQLTRAGTVMGTPAYMAPEQLRGLPCDAASDQFSFCVVAFEALFGQRPFAGRSLSELSVAIANEALAPLPVTTPVPRRLHAAVLRGLADQPETRWPDMSSLLAEFDHALARDERRAWKLAAGFALVAMTVGGTTALVSGRAEPELCRFDASALVGVWDDERRVALRRVYASSEQGSADESIALLDRALGAWGQRWLEGQRRNCEATRILGSQSEALLDLRASCLERQRREVAAVTQELTTTDANSLDRAWALLEELPEVARCEDPRLVLAPHPLPTEPSQREPILAAYEGLSQARAQLTLGRLEAVEATLAQLDARVLELDHLPLTLEHRFTRARFELGRGQLEAGVSRLREVVRAAEVAELDELSATVRTHLALIVAGHWGTPQTQANALDEAEIAVARLGRDHDPRGLDLSRARAAWLANAGELDEARVRLEALIERAHGRGDLVRVARAQLKLGRVLVDLGRFDEAEAVYRRAEAAFIETQGRGSLGRARVELDLAYLELGRGAFADARARLLELRQRHAALLESGSDFAAMVELADAKLAFMAGDLDQAEAGFRRVTESELTMLQRGEAWQAIGVIRFYAGDMQASLAAYRRARVELSQSLGPDHPNMGLLDSNIAEALAATGDHTTALAVYADALVILEAALPPDHADLAFPYKGRGQSQLALGQLDAARQDLERALAVHEQHPGEPVERADVEFSLARVLAGGKEHERALSLARDAQARLGSRGQDRLVAKIETWLDEHDPQHPTH